jgi:uncharacterized protein
MSLEIQLGKVVSSAPSSLHVEIHSSSRFEEHKEALQIGRYLEVAEGNRGRVVCVVRNLRAVERAEAEEEPGRFVVECQPVGSIEDDGVFRRGGVQLPVPTEPVYQAKSSTLEAMFGASAEFEFEVGTIPGTGQKLRLNGDRFFGKHLAVLGSSGAGKSCAVATVIQMAVGIQSGRNTHKERQRNAHVVVFDLHSEYAAAFSLPGDERFRLNVLNVETMRLPYWLMTSDELESMFIESSEGGSHNQRSVFKRAVTLNKERHNPTMEGVTYDTPVYFSLREVVAYIDNLNREVIGKLANEGKPKLADGTLICNRAERYFGTALEFVEPSTAAATKAKNGPFVGEFDKFMSRLETRLADTRLEFLLAPVDGAGRTIKTEGFDDIVKQFLGYLDRSNITIVDLSGVPFDVLSVTVSLVSRLVFDFCFHYSKLRHAGGVVSDVPVLLVCEEAHNYIPQSEAAEYYASRRSIERVAKEGRKYGVSLMVVSQRPSEVSETVLAQCSNFVVLRLTNTQDQSYVTRLLPDNASGITGLLPSLGPGECVVIGDAALLSSAVQLPLPQPHPLSRNVLTFAEWKRDWKDVTFADVIRRWRGQ